jgi:hypothetical protein
LVQNDLCLNWNFHIQPELRNRALRLFFEMLLIRTEHKKTSWEHCVGAMLIVIAVIYVPLYFLCSW